MQVSLKRAVTLVEVIAGVIILAITFAGLLATFVAVRKYVKRANKRLIAANLAVTQLNDLYRAVRADRWDPGPGSPYPLELATPGLIDNYTIDGQDYVGNSYSVDDLTPIDCRRVSVTVNYP